MVILSSPMKQKYPKIHFYFIKDYQQVKKFFKCNCKKFRKNQSSISKWTTNHFLSYSSKEEIFISMKKFINDWKKKILWLWNLIKKTKTKLVNTCRLIIKRVLLNVNKILCMYPPTTHTHRFLSTFFQYLKYRCVCPENKKDFKDFNHKFRKLLIILVLKFCQVSF